jgi:hypothetical protein
LLAKTDAYSDEVLDALRRMEAGAGAVEEIALSEAYLKTGGSLTEILLVGAGYRLGAMLKEVAANQ